MSKLLRDHLLDFLLPVMKGKIMSKNNGSTIALLMVLIGAPVSAQAAGGTITFIGALTQPTCEVHPGGARSVVTLPEVSQAFPGAALSGATAFTIQLRACAGPATSLTSYFDAGDSVNPAVGRLKNSHGSASGVDIQLLNADQTAINLNQDYLRQKVQPARWVSGAATLSFGIRYHVSAPLSSGSVAGVASYSIDYN